MIVDDQDRGHGQFLSVSVTQQMNLWPNSINTLKRVVRTQVSNSFDACGCTKSCRSRRRQIGGWQIERKRAAMAQLACDLDRPAVQLDQLPHDRQPKPAAALVRSTPRVNLLELLEQILRAVR